ncbi:hypothetical protein EYF80_059830 [Liparis tanakae]|uniref:Uncharacterized protein n=1 Tax=Liparis tanakae TaxID=230148 RepID=A0A4Z2EML6_9TELE|nr:hypothetical protein EYF80_059830 [Liparis tanakae]
MKRRMGSFRLTSLPTAARCTLPVGLGARPRRKQSGFMLNICCLGYRKRLVKSQQTQISGLALSQTQLPHSKQKHMSDGEKQA